MFYSVTENCGNKWDKSFGFIYLEQKKRHSFGTSVTPTVAEIGWHTMKKSFSVSVLQNRMYWLGV